jgi:hypothetical protein
MDIGLKLITGPFSLRLMLIDELPSCGHCTGVGVAVGGYVIVV